MALHLAMAAPASVAELKFDSTSLGLLRSEAQRIAVVRALVALAQGWQARVVATGVDDLLTRAWLAELGCDAAQGPPADANCPPIRCPGAPAARGRRACRRTPTRLRPRCPPGCGIQTGTQPERRGQRGRRLAAALTGGGHPREPARAAPRPDRRPRLRGQRPHQADIGRACRP